MGPLDDVPLFDELRIAEKNRTDVVLFEVEGKAVDIVRELQKLVVHDLFKAVNPGDAVADVHDDTLLLHLQVGFEAGDLFLDDQTDFIGLDVHDRSP
ncbi:MAG: hypothetical protein BWY86_01442 [Candidatus Aminicenantes bacterium ADurb.Bin508]|nr:MAG: hypothetical protein BWY86_01442 [Candidatus Aminicenantes bacterium ADurb.Bin508]